MTMIPFAHPEDVRRRIGIAFANSDAAKVYCDAVEANLAAMAHNLPDQFAVVPVSPIAAATATIFTPLPGFDLILKSIGVLAHDDLPGTSDTHPITVTVKNGAAVTIVEKAFDSTTKLTNGGLTDLGTLAHASISGDDGPITVTFTANNSPAYPAMSIILRYGVDTASGSPATIPVRVRRELGIAFGNHDRAEALCDQIEAMGQPGAYPRSTWFLPLPELAVSTTLTNYPLVATDQGRTIAAAYLTMSQAFAFDATHTMLVEITDGSGNPIVSKVIDAAAVIAAGDTGIVDLGVPDEDFATLSPGDVALIAVTPDTGVIPGVLTVQLELA